MIELTLKITTDQAVAISRMLDLATRIHLCQFCEIEYLARTGEIKHVSGRKLKSDEWDQVQDAGLRMKQVFGFGFGASFGVGSPHVSDDAHRGYEVKKVLDKALAEFHEPNPKGMRGVNYDGLIVRYTDDPAPVATVAARGGKEE
jgi:hypothetical protein